ncbi:MAG: D-alanyl-D-alanine carboxypeptidase/D-alanyl-D-alanine-endopeptidase, partial [Candidatus Eremiobacteraeota bacterium]|nr:D-alanyl-D-alanine carboxypeptidase/D-alanyl-D-alanine-endopeptidase [Candidatus Eremiobacteraeota bacterium]
MLATALAAALFASTATAVPKPVASGAPWTVAERAVLARDLDGLLSRAATVQGAHAGLLAVETATGHVLYARDAGDAFTPASSFKVLTGSAALATLGPDFTFETSVGAASSAAGTRLVLVGGGDALLRASDLEQAAAAVAGAGITSVAGVDADASYYDAEGYEPGWSWDDFPYYYAPLVSALCLEDNVVHATLTPGAEVGDRPGLTLQPPATLAIENRAMTGAPRSPDTVDVAREHATIVFTGSIPQDRVPEHLDAAVPDPNRYALEVFSDALVRHGVHID